MKQSTAIRVLLLVLAFGLIAAACGGGSDSGDEPKKGGTLRVELSEPDGLDPQQADDSEQILVMRQCYRGLVAYDPKTAAAIPGVAERWVANADASEWTFTLRKNSKFDKGEPVDANSFVRGWSNLTSKAAASPVAYHIAKVKGYDDQQSGKTKTLAGVTAVDQYTLKVTLSGPDAEFPVRTGHVALSPRPTDAAVAAQKPKYLEFPLCNGPFKLAEAHKHNQSITLAPNPNYYGAKPFVDQVVYKILADFDTAYNEWQAGTLDWTRIDPSKLKEAKAANPNKYVIKDVAGINYLSTNIKAKPTDNPLFRKAVSLAIDRKAISAAVFAGLNSPATGVIPPVMPGYRAPDAAGVGVCKWCKFDVTQAKSLLQQSGFNVSQTIQLSFNGGAGHETWMQAVAKQLQTNLGIKSSLKPYSPFSQFIKYRKSLTATGLMRNAWGMDYPTPDNFLFPLFHSTSDAAKGGDNDSHYGNPAFDKLVDDAQKTIDPAARLKLYQQAEDLVMDELPVIPMWWRTQFRLVATDKFGGLIMDAFEEPTVETAFQKATSS